MKAVDIVSVNGQVATFEILGDEVRVNGTIPHGDVFSREQMIAFAQVMLLTLSAPEQSE